MRKRLPAWAYALVVPAILEGHHLNAWDNGHNFYFPSFMLQPDAEDADTVGTLHPDCSTLILNVYPRREPTCANPPYSL